MTKKFFSVLMVMFAVFVSMTYVHATDGLFHMGTYEDIYKLSEQADIDLPFFNMFINAATYDKDVKHSGISFGSTTIDINEKLEGMHAIISTDMVTIKGEVENSFIYANNLVIEGKLSGDSIIIAPNVQIKENAIIEKDIIIIADNLNINGTVNGNVIATVAGKTTVSGVLNKDLRIITSDIDLHDEQIKGNVYIETSVDKTTIKEKYPEATVKSLTAKVEKNIDWMKIITKGIVVVLVYTLATWLITRKPNNIVGKMCERFKEKTVFGLLSSIIALVLVLILPLLLILGAIAGLGIIAWPILIAYAALILFVATTSILIVGMATYDTLKSKVEKFKLPAIALIYTVLYALTQITAITMHVNIAMLIIALALVFTMFTKKKEVEKQSAK